MKINSNKAFNRREEKQSKWHIVRNSAMGGSMFVFTVVCPRCNTTVLKYSDAVRLVPKEVEHCGEKDTFYIGEEILS